MWIRNREEGEERKRERESNVEERGKYQGLKEVGQVCVSPTIFVSGGCHGDHHTRNITIVTRDTKLIL